MCIRDRRRTARRSVGVDQKPRPGFLSAAADHPRGRPQEKGYGGFAVAAKAARTSANQNRRRADLGGRRRLLSITAAKTLKPVSYTHLRAHETPEHLVCRL